MIEGKLKNGFEFKVSDDALNDWELLELLEEIDSGNQVKIVKAFPLLLGNSQFLELKKYLKEKNGMVKTTEMVSAFAEMMQISNELKK